MSMTEIVKVFGERKIRSVWDDTAEEWYFSVVDVVAVLTESADPRNYWKVLKNRLKNEGNETVTNCNRLKLRAEDGKMRLMDVATPEQMFRLIQSIPSPKAEPFKIWMAKVAVVSLRMPGWRSRRRQGKRSSRRSTRRMRARLMVTMVQPPCQRSNSPCARRIRYNMSMREKMRFDEFALKGMDEILQPAAAQMSGEPDEVSATVNEVTVS